MSRFDCFDSKPEADRQALTFPILLLLLLFSAEINRRPLLQGRYKSFSAIFERHHAKWRSSRLTPRIYKIVVLTPL